MTYPDVANTSIMSAAGVARAQYAVIDGIGLPLGPTGAIAQGQDRGMGIMLGVKRAGQSAVQPRTVNVTGDNGRFLHKYLFNPESIGDLELNFGAFNMDAFAAATGTSVEAMDDWNLVGFQTDTPVNANALCLLVNIDAQDADTNSGNKRWFNLFFPIVAIMPQFGNHEEATGMEWPYMGSPTAASRKPWGVAFSTATNKFKRAAAFPITSRNPLTMHTFVRDGIASSFTLDYQPASDATGRVVKMWNTTPAGVTTVVTPTSVSVSTNTVVLPSVGTAGDIVVVLYEALDLMV